MTNKICKPDEKRMVYTLFMMNDAPIMLSRSSGFLVRFEAETSGCGGCSVEVGQWAASRG
jgi:hypothetical protein